MTHETAHPRHTSDTGSATGPAIGAVIIALIWAAYGVWVCYEIFTIQPG